MKTIGRNFLASKLSLIQDKEIYINVSPKEIFERKKKAREKQNTINLLELNILMRNKL